MLNEKTTATTGDDINAIADDLRNRRLAELAEHALPTAALPAEMAPYAERVRSILGMINVLSEDVGRLQDCVCPEYRPAVAEEAHRWLNVFEHVVADLARILAGPASCRAEFEAALAGLRDNADGRVSDAMQRHIVALAYATESIEHPTGPCQGYAIGEGSFLTGGNGAVLSAIGETVKPTRKTKTTKRARPATGKAVRK